MSGNRRWIALTALCAGQLMIVLDATIVTVALPSIREDLGFSQPDLAWVINSYLIALGGLLLLAGRVGDLVGRKRVFIAGLIAFTAASVACALATTPEALIGARFAQGVGAALTSAVVLGMITTTFTVPREQGLAIGTYSFVAAGGGSLGLVAGGLLTEAISWHWIFVVNVPIGLAAIVVGVRTIEADRRPSVTAGTDLAGALLVTVGLMVAVYAIVESSKHGWGSARTLSLLGTAVLLLVGFIAREATARRPLVPLRIFSAGTIAAANVIQAAMVGGMIGMFFLGSLYLERMLGYDALEIGLANLPSTLIIAAFSLRATPRLGAHFGPRPVLLAGLVLIMASLLLFARAPADASYVVDVLPVMVLLGCGVGLAFPSLVGLAMAGAAPEDAGVASGLFSTTQQVGGALGLAILATVATSYAADLQVAGEPETQALSSGYHLGFLIGAGFLLAALVVAIVALRQPARPIAESAGARYSDV